MVGYLVGGGLLAIAALNVFFFGPPALLPGMVLAPTGLLIMYGTRSVLRPAVSRDGDTLVCRYAPWNEVGISLAFSVIVLMAAVCLAAPPLFGPSFIPGLFLLACVIAVAVKFGRGHRRCLLTITPTGLSASLPDQSYAVTAIPREHVRTVEPAIQTIYPGRRDVLLTEITYSAGGSDPEATRTLHLGPAPATDTVWVSVRPANLLAAVQAWKDGHPSDPALLDRVEALLRRRGDGRG